jgi:hypothetical protein
LSQEAFFSLCIKHGATTSAKVTSRTTHLVTTVGNAQSGSSSGKLKRARALGIRVVNQKFIDDCISAGRMILDLSPYLLDSSVPTDESSSSSSSSNNSNLHSSTAAAASFVPPLAYTTFASESSKRIGATWDKTRNTFKCVIRFVAKGPQVYIVGSSDVAVTMYAFDYVAQHIRAMKLNLPGQFPDHKHIPNCPITATEIVNAKQAIIDIQRIINPYRCTNKYRCVIVDPNGRFRAKIQHEKETYHLGCFATGEEAARVVDDVLVMIKGRDDNLNFRKLQFFFFFKLN